MGSFSPLRMGRRPQRPEWEGVMAPALCGPPGSQKGSLTPGAPLLSWACHCRVWPPHLASYVLSEGNSFILTRQRVLGNTIHCGPPAVLWCGSQQLTGAGVRVERDLIILTVQQGRGAVYSQNPLNHPVVNGEAEATRMMAGLLPRQEEQMAPL